MPVGAEQNHQSEHLRDRSESRRLRLRRRINRSGERKSHLRAKKMRRQFKSAEDDASRQIRTPFRFQLRPIKSMSKTKVPTAAFRCASKQSASKQAPKQRRERREFSPSPLCATRNGAKVTSPPTRASTTRKTKNGRNGGTSK